MPVAPIRVMIVDDSAVIRDRISAALEEDRQITVISTAMNVAIAKHKIQRDQPDVLLLDMNLSGSSGLALLKSMPVVGLPVVIYTGYAPEGSEEAAEAMQAGAAAVIQKPTNGHDLQASLAELKLALKAAAKSSRPRKPRDTYYTQGTGPNAASDALEAAGVPTPRAMAGIRGDKVIAIGASTGGTDAIRDLLMALPPNCPPIVAVIHMPDLFTSGFARRLNQLCPMRVEEARDGQVLESGLALIAPGDRHIALRMRRDGTYHVAVFDAPRVMRHRPSVEVLFESVANSAGDRAMGIMLTGMGADGAKGMLSMRNQGAMTVAQSERTCVVFGMPARAIELGATELVADLNDIPTACVNWMRKA